MQIEVGCSTSVLKDVPADLVPTIKKAFTYTNTSIGYQISQFKKKLRWARQNGRDSSITYYEREIAKLELDHRVCLVKPVGSDWRFPTGLVARMCEMLGTVSVVDSRKVPNLKTGFPAVGALAKLRPEYQTEQLAACLQHRQGTIESATGTGKTVVIQELLRKLGLKALLVVPSISILDQTISRFEAYFGKGRVGQFGDGKKHIRDITIACAPSILKSKPSEWDHVDVLIFDECHHVACETIERICYEFVPNAYYRFGFTATPYRADGADLAIEGGVFPVIHRYTVQQGINDGYLAKPHFVMVRIDRSESDVTGGDHLKMFQAHVVRNDYLNSIVVNQALAMLAKDKQVIILVKEKEQGHLLWKKFEGRGWAVEFARTKESAADREKLDMPLAPWEDPTKQVARFNRGTLRCLIGTSVIGEGTDLIPVDALFLLGGGASKGVVLQNVGRGLRISATKKSVIVFDYSIEVEHRDGLITDTLFRHASKRVEWYAEIASVKKIEGAAFFA